MTARNLRIVAEPAPAPIDIHAQLRADIARRDWAAVHIAGDRRAPVFLPDTLKRLWRLAS